MAIGDLVRTPKGWTVTPPTHCPAGHRFIPGRMTVGYSACAGPYQNGHTTWTCGCGDTVYAPALSPECSLLHGPAGVRNV